jgi:hypothetical protein
VSILAAMPPLPVCLAFRAEAAHQEDDQADNEDKAEAPSSKRRTADVEAAAAEQKKQNDHEQY